MHLFLTIEEEVTEKEQSLHLTDKIIASILKHEVLSMDVRAIEEKLYREQPFPCKNIVSFKISLLPIGLWHKTIFISFGQLLKGEESISIQDSKGLLFLVVLFLVLVSDHLTILKGKL